MTSGVTVTKKGSVEIRLNALLDFLVAAAVGVIQRRSAKGVGLNGPFPAYSPSYAAALREGGESTAVDLTVTGAYLAGISERSRTVDVAGMKASATIGPGTGTSEQRHFADGKAKRTGKRSPPHAVLARLLSIKYPHLGLRPEEMKQLAAQAAKIALAKKP